jgi:hypothetical protein
MSTDQQRIKQPPVPSAQRSGWNWSSYLRLINIAIGIVGGACFMVVTLIYLLGATRWRPRDFMIAYSIIYGLFMFLPYVTCWIRLLTCKDTSQLAEHLGASAGWGTVRRFNTYFTFVALNFVTQMATWWAWCSHNTIPAQNTNYLTGASSYAPTKLASGYYTFDKLCALWVLMYSIDIIFNIIFTRDLFESAAPLSSPATNSGGGGGNGSKNAAPPLKNNFDTYNPDADAIRRPTRINNAAAAKGNGGAVTAPSASDGAVIVRERSIKYGYLAGVGILYIVSLVYFLIMFVQIFNIKTMMQLNALYPLLIVMTIAYIIMIGTYYWRGTGIQTELRRAVVEAKYYAARELDYRLLGGHLFWAFNIVFNWIFFAYYWSQQGINTVNFSSYPLFNPNPGPTTIGSHTGYIQSNGWYIWQIQALYNASSITWWLATLLPITFLFMRPSVNSTITLGAGDYESQPAPNMTKEEIADVNKQYGSFVTPENTATQRRPTASGASASPAGGRPAAPTYAVEEKSEWWQYIILGLYWVLMLLVFGMCISALVWGSWLAVGYQTFIICFSVIGVVYVVVVLALFAQRSKKVDVRINEMWMLSMWLILMGLPLYYLMSISGFWGYYWMYYNTFHSSSAIGVIIEQPASVPLNSLTFYWWSIPTFQMFLVYFLIYLLTEINSIALAKSFHRTKRAGAPPKIVNKSRNSGSEGEDDDYTNNDDFN